MFPDEIQARHLEEAGLGWNLRFTCSPARSTPRTITLSVGRMEAWTRKSFGENDTDNRSLDDLSRMVRVAWSELIYAAINAADIEALATSLRIAAEDSDWKEVRELSARLLMLQAKGG